MVHVSLTSTTGQMVDENELYQSFTVPTGGKRFTQGCFTPNWMCVNLTTAHTYMGERIDVSVPDITLKVGETKTLSYEDRSQGLIDKLVGAKNTISQQWNTDCEDPAKLTSTTKQITLSPTKPVDCYVSVKVLTAGGIGCWVCAEVFDMLPLGIATFKLAVLPSSYTPPQPPNAINNLAEKIYEDKRVVTWSANNSATNSPVAYVIKDSDGSVLSITSQPQITINDVSPDEIIAYSIQVLDGSGASSAVSSDTALKINDISPPRVVINDPPLSSVENDPSPIQPDSEAAKPSSNEEGRDIREPSGLTSERDTLRGANAAVSDDVIDRRLLVNSNPSATTAVLSEQSNMHPVRLQEGYKLEKKSSVAVAPSSVGLLVNPAILLGVSGGLFWVVVLVGWRRRKKRQVQQV
jgi:hypothetical protein